MSGILNDDRHPLAGAVEWGFAFAQEFPCQSFAGTAIFGRHLEQGDFGVPPKGRAGIRIEDSIAAKGDTVEQQPDGRLLFGEAGGGVGAGYGTDLGGGHAVLGDRAGFI